MLNDQQQGIITLVHSALTGEKLPLPAGFEPEEAVKFAQRHQVTNLLYYGAVNCGISRDLPFMQRWFSLVCHNVLICEQQLYAIDQMLTAFSRQGIDYLPLKGTLLKQLYPSTDMRLMGDADILIRREQYKKTRAVMRELGYEDKGEFDHELKWQRPELYVELHRQVIPSSATDFYRYYKTGWQLARPTDTAHRFVMSDEDHFVFLFCHFAAHYRAGGIGIRHITDLWVYLTAKPALDLGYIRNELEKLQLDVFFDNVCETLGAWFEGKAFAEKAELITLHIFGSGAYGTREYKELSKAVKSHRRSGTLKRAHLRRIRERIFLPYSFMCIRYRFLPRAPFLLPVMWVVRWFAVLTTKPEHITRDLQKERGMDNAQIEAWEDTLRYVGLDFHYKE